MAIVCSDYNSRVLNNKLFFFSSSVVLILVLAATALFYLPTPFDTVIAYHKTEMVPVQTADSPKLLSEIDTVVEAAEVEVEEPVVVTEIENDVEELPIEVDLEIENKTDVPTVPFYSQFSDITSDSWKKVGCGIASLAMLIEYYNPGSVEVDNLLQEGIDASAYLDSAGWVYAGLIGISKKYGLGGKTHDFGSYSMEDAYGELVAELEEGPVMASVHYTFQKTNPIPHLVIINGIKDGVVYYNDPAEKAGGGEISAAQFKSAWKKRYIEFRLI